MMAEHVDPDEFFRREDVGAAGSFANGHDPSPGLQMIRFDEMQPRLGDGYLVKHLLSSTAMAVVYGESGTGKTFWALHLALSIAAELEFFGRRVRRVGVVYVAAEAGVGIVNRVVAAKHEFAFPEMMPFAAITTPIDLCTDTADIEKLIIAVKSAGLGVSVGLIIIDTLSRVMAGANENSPDDMGALVRNVDRLRAETGAAVVLVHHSGKDASRGARGHSLLRAATDTEIEITRDDATKVVTARVTKQRDHATDGVLSFVLRRIDLGIDQDGDTITSCIVQPADGVGSTTKRPVKLTGAAAVGMEQLRNCLADRAIELPVSDHMPTGIRGVTLTYWREYLEKAGVINPEGNPREQFRRIRVTLQDRGYIGVWDDFVWPSHAVTGASR